ncbi:hypothetical protein FJ693_19155 [Georgenia yuyongxinii]|uniref:Copper resistance protein D domain-containing protein n=1 Tax=Georgenia yuyongxinii TaxID=2589797 RepID=A0A552WJX7_9MICO|nr:hypothetical protein FJ693_19155 [Georgenia yuyongxinii]
MTEYGLGAARALAETAAVGTVGTLLLLAVLAPRTALLADLTRTDRVRRAAGSWAAVWAMATVLQLLLASSELVGLSVPELLGSGQLGAVLLTPPGRALISTALVAVIVAAGARSTSWAVAPILLVLAVLGLVPSLLTGHATHGDSPALALAGVVLHVPAVALWGGGLLAVVVHLRRWPDVLAVALPRFSAAAGYCYGLVLLSGVLMVMSRLPEPGQLLSTPYGRLVLAKVAVLVVLGVFGLLHRRRTVQAATQGRPRALLRLGAVELLLMATAIGLGAGLATTAPPV